MKNFIAICSSIEETYNSEELAEIPQDKEELRFSWKNNLGSLGFPTQNIPENKLETLKKLGIQVATAMNMRIGAVDIVEISDGSWKVIEVNSSITVATALRLGHDLPVTKVYRAILKKCFS